MCKQGLKKILLTGIICSLSISNIFAADDSENLENKKSENVYVIQKKEDVLPVIVATALGASLTSLGLYTLYDQMIVKKRSDNKFDNQIVNVKFDSKFDTIWENLIDDDGSLVEKIIMKIVAIGKRVEAEEDKKSAAEEKKTEN